MEHWYIVGAETHEFGKEYAGSFFEHETFDSFPDALEYYSAEVGHVAKIAGEYAKNGYTLTHLGLYLFINPDKIGEGERIPLLLTARPE